MFEPYGYGDVFHSGLREIVALRVVLDALEAELVVGGRLRGHPWTVLAEDLELSPGGVRKRHLAVDPIYARKPVREPTLTDVLAALAAPEDA